MTAFEGPPRKCPHCLLGACHGCTGRMVVLNARGIGRDERCEHQHPRPAPVEPVGVPMLADIPVRSTAGRRSA